MKHIVVFILLFAITSCMQQEVQVKAIPQDGVILAFGDALTLAPFVAKDKNYPSVLAKLTGRKVINAGEIDATTQNSLKRLVPLLTQYKPSLVIVALGTRDFKVKKPEVRVKKYLTMMVKVIRRYEAEPVLIAAPLPAYILNPSPIYMEIGQEQKVLVLNNLQSKVLANAQYRAKNGQLNAAGFKSFAEAINKALREYKFIVQEPEKKAKVSDKDKKEET